jgi:hypothetical protein
MLRLNRRFFLTAIASSAVVSWGFFQKSTSMEPKPQLLTDPFLQLPTENSVLVVWFTEFAGTQHTVAFGEDLKQVAIAKTSKLSRTYEDQNSRVGTQTENGQVYTQPTLRNIWRHEAEVTGLTPNQRVPYRVTSTREDGQRVSSEVFTLVAKPTVGTPLKILLTSDHQLKPMVAANLQKVVETVGQVDAVFFAGDLANVPDRASEWFDDNRGGAFFPALQGHARYELGKDGAKTQYVGGKIIQHAPMFTAIGNHEVMGRFSPDTSLNSQFDDAFPRAIAQKQYTQDLIQINPNRDPLVEQRWLKDQSFNTDTYEELFTLPQSEMGGERYYAVSFGDIRLVVLYVTNIWRTSSLASKARGKYRERQADFDKPENWGYGQHIFESIAKDSPQYNWLQQELASSEFQQAKYKIVMFHHPPHSLGENSVPAYTDPLQIVERDEQGKIQAVRYEYPQKDDYIIRDLLPLLESAKVQLVFFGHSHLWNRFISPNGMHFLETSNVGNSYGAHVGEKKRDVPETGYRETYAATGNPNGLEPIMPTIAPITDDQGQPTPYIASNDITAFSILDTGTGTISSYRFDTRDPQSPVVKFDEFTLQ